MNTKHLISGSPKTIKLILPAIRDQEGADLYERAKEELELLKLQKKPF